MRALVVFDVVLFLGCLVAAGLSLAGVSEAASAAVALGGFAVAFAVPMLIGQAGNWGVPGDEPPLWHRQH
jgi:hypothetical protein